jgi:hypothetical protein
MRTVNYDSVAPTYDARYANNVYDGVRDTLDRFDSAVARGLVGRSATSQLMVIGDAEWETGRRRLETERPVLRADLTLYASFAWR